MIPAHTMQLYVHLDIHVQFQTMFKIIAIDLILLLVNFCPDIALLGPGE